MLIMEKRFQTRMPRHVHEKLSKAAELLGATLNQFIVQSALDKANTVLEQERILNLTLKDAEVFFEAMENPPKPNEEILKAAQVYKMEFGND
ncbi:MAG: DUF1778 domain-containing protein [Desulfobacterales bacterium]|nr:DUF1778 domain-containing protein [Desulfobacterales bacterium]